MKIQIVFLWILGVLGAASAEASYGAIAYSPSTGSSGVSWGYWYQHDAINAAVSNCNWSDCRAVVWVNNACGSLAVSHFNSYHFASAWAYNRFDADQAALRACGLNCYSKAWVCSFN